MKLTPSNAFAAILVIVNSAAPVVAGPFEDAPAAYDKGNCNCATSSSPLAEQGTVAINS